MLSVPPYDPPYFLLWFSRQGLVMQGSNGQVRGSIRLLQASTWKTLSN